MHHDEPTPRRRRHSAIDDRDDEAGRFGRLGRRARPAVQARKLVTLLLFLAALVATISASTLCAGGGSCDVERPFRILLGEDAGAPH